MTNDNIQHGIDDDPNNDPKKARNIGGVGGAVTGAIAGSAAGPVGTVVGAVVGAVAGGLGSQAAVAAVDKVDNDNTITGIGSGATHKDEYNTTVHDRDVLPGNGVPGVQTGGHANDGTPDTRGVTEKLADTVTGDPYDDKTGKRVDGGAYADNAYRTGTSNYGDGDTGGALGGQVSAGTRAETALGGNGLPGVQTGGRNADGTPDTRGVGEKLSDAVTGDRVDDKTGKLI